MQTPNLPHDPSDLTPAEGGSATPPGQVPHGRGTAGRWREILRQAWQPRANRANLLALVLFALLGFAIATQVRSTRQQGIEGLSESQLISILDNVTEQNNRLNAEARQLEATRNSLTQGQGSAQEALQTATARLRTLGVLAGTLPAKGPGLVLTITDLQGKVGSIQFLDAVQELRDAGAEAVQVGSVRVVASTWFADAAEGISVSGTDLRPPYTLTVIGEPKTMAAALGIPGGVEETIAGKGGRLTIVSSQELTVSALHTVQTPRYARPVDKPNP